jgi:hypothetical protein
LGVTVAVGVGFGGAVRTVVSHRPLRIRC